MSDNTNPLIKNFYYTTLIFAIIFMPFIIVNQFIYGDFDQFIGNYVFLNQHARHLLSSGSLPMYSAAMLTSGNFLGMQNMYSIYSPFFLVTLLFPTDWLGALFVPLLFLKTILAGGALTLYMKETKWFSPLTTAIALVLYLFQGWYFSYLHEFVLIELMIYLPYALFGIECLFSRGTKRHLALALTLLLITHFSFTLLLIPFLLVYGGIRFHYLREQLNPKKIARLTLFAIVTALGVSMIVVLPIILAANTVRLTAGGELTFQSLLFALFKNFIPAFHESYPNGLNILHASRGMLPLFQSLLVILLLPQFIKLLPKPTRLTIIFSYILLQSFVLIIQVFPIENSFGIVSFNLNVFSLLLMLFNALIIAYVLKDVHKLDRNLLKITSWGYKIALILLMGIVLLMEFAPFLGRTDLRILEIIRQGLLPLTPYFLLGVGMFMGMDLYQYLLNIMANEHQHLRRKSIFIIIIIERVVLSYVYLNTHSHQSLNMHQVLADPNYVGNQVGAVVGYLRAIDPEFHRVINSFQIHDHEPLARNYHGFANRESADYFLTTALGAKYYLTVGAVSALPGYVYFERIGDVTIYQNQHFVTAGSSMEYYINATDFKALTKDQQRYLFLRAVILEATQVASLAEPLSLQTIDLEQVPEIIGEIQYLQAARYRQGLNIADIIYEPNRFVHNYETDQPSLIVYSIPYERGWRATAAGQRLRIHQVNQGFLGIAIPEAGAYEITLQYRTPGLIIGAISSVTMLILIAGYFFKHQEDKVAS